MTTRLFVAAGGGGDPIAAAIIAHALGDGGRAQIATLAWERLAIDPRPGPRKPSDFSGLRQIAPQIQLVRPESRLIGEGSSMLPRLAAELDADIFLLDPTRGAVGLRHQLTELARLLGADQVEVVDVGGDVLADGDEESLRSPLADSLTLAATHGLYLPVEVLVAGAGLDGELPADLVTRRCKHLAQSRLSIPTAIARRYGSLFEWHPSEATGLLWAAAVGVRGVVELRDYGAQVTLTGDSAQVWSLRPDDVLAVNRIAQTMRNAASLDEAELAVTIVSGESEIDYERTKSRTLASSPQDDTHDPANALARLPQIEADAAERSVDFLTVRRIAEILGLPVGGLARLRRHLRPDWFPQYLPPLWAVHKAARETLRRIREAEQV